MWHDHADATAAHHSVALRCGCCHSRFARSFVRSFVAPAALPRHLRCVDVVVVVVVFIVASHWTRPRIGDSLLRPQPAPTVRLGDVCLDFFFFFGATSAIIKNSGIRM